jgi:O-antigen/teichoic acid export membrane protein
MGRGQLASLLQPLTVADAFAALGVPAAVAYFTAGGFQTHLIARYSRRLIAVSCAIVYAVLVTYSSIISRAAETPRLLVCLLWSSVGLGAVIACRRARFQGMREYGAIDTERSLFGISRLLAIAGLFALGSQDALSFAAASILAGAATSALVLWIRRPRAPSRCAPGSVVSSRVFTRFALLASISSISGAVNSRLDQAMLPALLNPADVGLYAVAATVAEVPLVISLVLNRNVLAERSANESSAVIVRMMAISIGGIAIVCALLGLAAPVFIPFLFGSDFYGVVPIVRILLLASVLGTAAGGLSAHLTGAGKPGLGSLGPAVGSISTVLLLVLLSSRMSPHLAAWIAVLAQCMSVLAAILMILQRRRK